MTFEEYVKEELKWEEYRQGHHCCSNCVYFFREYGQDLCKYWDNCEEDVEKETKCAQWR